LRTRFSVFPAPKQIFEVWVRIFSLTPISSVTRRLVNFTPSSRYNVAPTFSLPPCSSQMHSDRDSRPLAISFLNFSFTKFIRLPTDRGFVHPFCSQKFVRRSGSFSSPFLKHTLEEVPLPGSALSRSHHHHSFLRSIVTPLSSFKSCC